MNPILSIMSRATTASVVFLCAILLLWFGACIYIAYLWWPQ